jgi:hypothetical protein
MLKGHWRVPEYDALDQSIFSDTENELVPIVFVQSVVYCVAQVH